MLRELPATAAITAIRITDRLANFAGWMQERAKSYPTADGLRCQLEGAGLQTTLRPLYGDTPFNNWLVTAVRGPPA